MEQITGKSAGYFSPLPRDCSSSAQKSQIRPGSRELAGNLWKTHRTRINTESSSHRRTLTELNRELAGNGVTPEAEPLGELSASGSVWWMTWNVLDGMYGAGSPHLRKTLKTRHMSQKIQ